jgi:hypothetical protein
LIPVDIFVFDNLIFISIFQEAESDAANEALIKALQAVINSLSVCDS